jgi:hypothetical protein
MGDCVKGCVEEEDRSVAQGFSSFMLQAVWVLMPNCP